MVIVVSKTDVEFALTIAAIPVTILILIMAGYFTRRESKLGVAAIIVRHMFKRSLLQSTDMIFLRRHSILQALRTSCSSWSGCISTHNALKLTPPLESR